MGEGVRSGGAPRRQRVCLREQSLREARTSDGEAV